MMATNKRPSIHDLHDCAASPHSLDFSPENNNANDEGRVLFSERGDHKAFNKKETLKYITKHQQQQCSDMNDTTGDYIKKDTIGPLVVEQQQQQHSAFIDENVLKQCVEKATRPESWTSEVFRKKGFDPAYPNPTRIDKDGKNIYQSPLDYEPLYSSVTRNRKYPESYSCLECKRVLPVDYFPRKCFDKFHPGGVMAHPNSLLSKAYYKSDCPKPQKQKHSKLKCHECLLYLKMLDDQSKYIGDRGEFKGMDHYERLHRHLDEHLHFSDINGISTKMLSSQEKKCFQLEKIKNKTNATKTTRRKSSSHKINDKTIHHDQRNQYPQNDDRSFDRSSRNSLNTSEVDSKERPRPWSSPLTMRRSDGVATIQSPKWHSELLGP